MNLLLDAWMPVRRRSGHDWIAPWQLTDEDDPVLDFDAARPDFNAALWQFCIGLLATLMPPVDAAERRERLNTPPSPEALKALFETHAHAFELDGDGPRFMQDFDAQMDGADTPISGLLIDSPGGKTVRDNTDHFVKRDRVESLCKACAALALFTLQLNAPSGGSGHRTSLRGGGPLTTLVRFSPQARSDGAPITAWSQLWLNVCSHAVERSPSSCWPWMASTRTSINDEVITAVDSPYLTVYWGMPRRIRLKFVEKANVCDLCGRGSKQSIREYVTQTYGANYLSSGWLHPLSPYYRGKAEGEWLPEHPQEGGIGYRHWPALLYGNAAGGKRQADVIDCALELASRPGNGWNRYTPLRLWAFGFDIYNNMKARSWHEADMPVYAVEDPKQLGIYADLLQQLVGAADLVRRYTTGAVRRAWLGDRDAKGDFSDIDRAFWARTEPAFFQLAAQMRDAVTAGDDDESLRQRWLDVIRRAAREVFDERAANAPLGDTDPAVLAAAHNDLQKKLRGPKLLGQLGLARDNPRTAGRKRSKA